MLQLNVSARVVELVDTQDLKSCDRKIVWVQVPSRVHIWLVHYVISTFASFFRNQSENAQKKTLRLRGIAEEAFYFMQLVKLG